MDAEGFDVLTWREVPADDVDPHLFGDLTYTDETGRGHTGGLRMPPWTYP